MVKNPIKEREKNDKINANKINNQLNCNKNNSCLFYKTLNTRRINSNFYSDFMKYNSSNNININLNFQNQLDNNNYNNKFNSFFDKNTKYFYSTQTKMVSNDNIINSFRSSRINKFINNNIIPLLNDYEGGKSPSYKKKIKKFEKVEFLPTLKNRLLNNNKLKNKKNLCK